MTAEPTGTNDEYSVSRVWKLIDKIHVCMLATRDREQIRARPMSAIGREGENTIYFLTDEKGHKDEQIDDNGYVCLIFAKPDSGKFMSVNGTARVLQDAALTKELWSTAAEAFWESPEDPSIRIIQVTPQEAEFWEGPHGLVATVQMVIAAATSAPPVLGDQRKVDLH
ncbi:MAG: pyridoxamine 5'-phosphate oxidase family protein [Terricaulis sp.]